MNKPEWFRFIKFGLISISAGVIEIVTFTLLTELTTLRYWPCYLTALILSVLWNFTINRKYTFHSAARIPRAMALVGLYYLVFTPLSTWFGDWLTETILWNGYLVTLLNMILNFVTEFLFQRYIVYRGQIDTAPVVEKSK